MSEGCLYGLSAPSRNAESGRQMRDLLDCALKIGNCIYNDFSLNAEAPEIVDAVNKVKEQLIKKCIPYKLKAYARVNTSTDDDFLNTISREIPIITVIPIYESFYQAEKTGFVPIPNTFTEKLLGYHAITCLGYDDDMISEDKKYTGHDVFLNHWGEWGDNGYIYLPYGYPKTEQWVVTFEYNNKENNIWIKLLNFIKTIINKIIHKK
jgi:hypothetical protein